MTQPDSSHRAAPPRPAPSSDGAPTRDGVRAVTRTIGALSLLVVGGVHYQQYRFAFYSVIPTIGPLFLVNFVAASGLGLFLISPVRPRGRLGAWADRLAALAGAGLSAGAFAALLISEQTPLFGFQEYGYRFVVVLALGSEALTVAMLSCFLWLGPPAWPRKGSGGHPRRRFSPLKPHAR